MALKDVIKRNELITRIKQCTDQDELDQVVRENIEQVHGHPYIENFVRHIRLKLIRKEYE